MTDLLTRLDDIASSGRCTPTEAIEMAHLLLRARARSRDRTTSKDAAASVTSMTSKRKAVLDLLKRLGPCTDPQLVWHYEGSYDKHAALKQTPQSIRSRRSELVRMGYVQAAGKAVTAGRKHTIWEIVRQKADKEIERQ